MKGTSHGGIRKEVGMTDLQAKLSRWKSRNSLLFVFSPCQDDHFCKIQRELFGDCEKSLQGSGLIVAEVFEQGGSHIGAMRLDSSSSAYLRRQFNIALGEFKVLLLGKDQHIKLATDSFVSQRELLMRLEPAAPEGVEAVFS
jgi:hypothetical protein